jgi:hypothetical protein
VSGFATDAVFFPNRDDYSLEPGPRSDYVWQRGSQPSAEYQTTLLGDGTVSDSCEQLLPLRVSGTALQFWPEPLPRVLRVESSLEQPLLIEAVAGGDELTNAGEFSVEACAACEAGSPVDCQEIDSSYGSVVTQGASAWLRVEWNPEHNRLLTVQIH